MTFRRFSIPTEMADQRKNGINCCNHGHNSQTLPERSECYEM
jgi:hypothetical protein